jgi:uncharacterized membrane protein YeaQ/YmgE (transglycosylase-associated protein family)
LARLVASTIVCTPQPPNDLAQTPEGKTSQSKHAWLHDAPDKSAAAKNTSRLMQINSHLSDAAPSAATRRAIMNDAGLGWIAAIIIGGIAGWLAERFMKSSMGLIMNIVLGIVGAAIASAILSYFGIHLGGWIGYLISGFIGAVLLIWIVRVIRPA